MLFCWLRDRHPRLRDPATRRHLEQPCIWSNLEPFIANVTLQLKSLLQRRRNALTVLLTQKTRETRQKQENFRSHFGLSSWYQKTNDDKISTYNRENNTIYKYYPRRAVLECRCRRISLVKLAFLLLTWVYSKRNPLTARRLSNADPRAESSSRPIYNYKTGTRSRTGTVLYRTDRELLSNSNYQRLSLVVVVVINTKYKFKFEFRRPMFAVVEYKSRRGT